MVKAPTHARKKPPPGRPVAPLVVQGRAVSATSLRSSGTSSSGRTASTERTGASSSVVVAEGGKRPDINNRPSSKSAQPNRGRGSQANGGRGAPRQSSSQQRPVRPAQNGGRGSNNRSNNARPPTQQQQQRRQQTQQQQQPTRKAPPTHLLTGARTSRPGGEVEQEQQEQRRQQQQQRQQLQPVQENETGGGDNDNVFEALTWNPFQGDDGRTNNAFWSGGSTQAGMTNGGVVHDTDSAANVDRWSEFGESSTSSTMQTFCSDGTGSQYSSVFDVEGGVHVPNNSKNRILGGSKRITGKTTRKLAGRLGSKLTYVGAKARGLTQSGDDAFYGTGEAGYSTTIRTITEEEAYGTSIATSTPGTTTVVSGTPQSNAQRQQQQQQQQQQRQQPTSIRGQQLPIPTSGQPQSIEQDGRTPSSRSFIPTAFARLASVQNLSAGGATATAQAVPAAQVTPTATVLSATTVVARTTSLRPPAPMIVGGKVVVKGVALNRSLSGDLNAIEALVEKYKRLRAINAQREGSRATVQSNSELAASIAELRACLPKLEALVNRAMLSRTADANALEKCLSLNDELRKILASLKGEGIKRRVRDGPARASQLPTAQAAREQQLFKKMREDSNELTAPSVGRVVDSETSKQRPSNEEPLFHDDPFHGFPEPSFDSIPENETLASDKAQNISKPTSGSDQRRVQPDDDSKSEYESDTSSTSMLPVVSEDDQNGSIDSVTAVEPERITDDDRRGLSRLEDEVARLEKQLSGLDPLAKLAMDTVLDEDMSYTSMSMSGLSIMSDGEASADAGFAGMEREMLNQLAMGNDWMASPAAEEEPKISRVKFSQEVTVFEIPNRHQARAAME